MDLSSVDPSIRRPMKGALDERSFMEEIMRVPILIILLLQLAVILRMFQG